MTTERDKCGLSSLLPMSCRGRAEAFARRLHSRLRSLGSEDGNGSADETSWLAGHENSIALSQPRHSSSDSDIYLDFGLLDSPGSPEEELDENDLHRLINKDNLKHSHSEECHCPKSKEKKLQKTLNNICERATDSDSSDGPFYDTEDQLESRVNGLNGHVEENKEPYVNGFGSKSDSDESISQNDESYCTISEGTHLNEELSMFSLKDEDYSSVNGCASELEDNSLSQSKELGSNDSEKEQEVKCNGLTNGDNVYISSLNIQNELTVECPKPIQNSESEISIVVKVENEEDEDSEERIPRVRRCSSLKTGKTPPGTPGRKKIVRFADVLGLDLADVRTFLDEIPKIPISAYEDLTDVDLTDSSDSNSLSSNPKFHGVKSDKVLVPLFQQPGGLVNFLDLVRDNLVCLENAVVDDPLCFSIKGSVRVRNLDFHKSVHIRYTLNSWKTFADVQATYVENSCDGFSDKFTFTIYAHTLTVGQRLEFAVRFQCKGCQYWDNNKGANYCFQCLPATNNAPYVPITCSDDWGASFY